MYVYTYKQTANAFYLLVWDSLRLAPITDNVYGPRMTIWKQAKWIMQTLSQLERKQALLSYL